MADDPDLVLFLGDYIYEGATGKKALRPHQPVEAHDLATYRTRYGLYKSDPKLKAAHACAPWMVIWTTTEVDNDYGLDQDRSNPDPAAFLRRRAAAYQAYYEHMPLRRTAAPVGPDMLLYRALNWGQLAQFQFTRHPPSTATAAPAWRWRTASRSRTARNATIPPARSSACRRKPG